jgi:transposase
LGRGQLRARGGDYLTGSADTVLIRGLHAGYVSAVQTRRPGLAAQPIGRFTFTFTPTHGSWLNLIEGFFSKLARSVLRHIRVSSKHELKERLIAFIGDINREPVVHTWRYKIDTAA